MRPDESAYKIVDSSFGEVPEKMEGRFVSSQPSTAGKNAGKKMFRLADAKIEPYAKFAGETSVIVRIQGVVSGKTYAYRVTRTKRAQAENMSFAGSKFKAEWDYEVTKATM